MYFLLNMNTLQQNNTTKLNSPDSTVREYLVTFHSDISTDRETLLKWPCQFFPRQNVAKLPIKASMTQLVPVDSSDLVVSYDTDRDPF